MTPEQIKQMLEKAISDSRPIYPSDGQQEFVYTIDSMAIESFFTRAYELGWKNRGEAAADTMDNIARTIANMLAANAEAIRNNTGEP